MGVARLPGAARPEPAAGRNLLGPALRQVLLALSRSGTARALASGAPPARALARRFVAGETRAEALQAVARLRAEGIAATVDFLGESVDDPAQAEAYAAEYLRLAEELAGTAHVSLKLTGLGIDVDPSPCRDLLTRVAERAAFVRVDMEGSAYTARTLELVRGVRARHPNVGVVLQAYLYRTAADLAGMLGCGVRVRLCKGAYDEPPSVAFPAKADVDRNFLALGRRLLEEGDYPAFATHDERIVDELLRHARERGIGRERFEFQMLYGIGRDLQRRLVGEGLNVRVYVPYGSHWYPYFMRRLAERPANLLFFLRSLR